MKVGNKGRSDGNGLAITCCGLRLEKFASCLNCRTVLYSAVRNNTEMQILFTSDISASGIANLMVDFTSFSWTP